MRCRSLFVALLFSAAVWLPAQTPPVPESHLEVEVAGGLSSSYIAKGHDVGFWIRVINHSAQPVTGLHVANLDASAAYSIVGCWSNEPSPRLAANGSCNGPTLTLAKGQEVSLGGVIRARDLAEQETVGVLVNWTNDKLTSSHEVILGQLSSDSRFTYWLETHPVLVSLFSVGLLGLAGYLLKNAFDSSRHAAEIERTRQAETWNQLLKEAGKFSLEYYLPVEGALSSFIGQSQKHLRSASASRNLRQESAEARLNSRLAFYYWAYFERRMLQIKRRIGGVHFKDYTGEEIVTFAYARYSQFCYARNEQARATLDAMLERMPLNTTASRFLQKLDGTEDSAPDPTVVGAWEFFHRWLHKDDALKALRSLDAMRVILDYELNRPYYYWYGSLEPLELTDEQLDEIMGLGSPPNSEGTPIETTAAKDAADKWKDALIGYLSRSK